MAVLQCAICKRGWSEAQVLPVTSRGQAHRMQACGCTSQCAGQSTGRGTREGDQMYVMGTCQMTKAAHTLVLIKRHHGPHLCLCRLLRGFQPVRGIVHATACDPGPASSHLAVVDCMRCVVLVPCLQAAVRARTGCAGQAHTWLW